MSESKVRDGVSIGDHVVGDHDMDAASAVRFAEIAAALAHASSVQNLCEIVIRLAVELTSCHQARIDLVGAWRGTETVARTSATDKTSMPATTSLTATSSPTATTFLPGNADRSAQLQLPLRSRTGEFGTLTLYSADGGGFGPIVHECADLLARHASIALGTLQNEEHLRISASTRTVIGQAQGILMERYGISADKAFAVLRRYSQDANVKLLGVAERIVATRRLPESQ